MPVSRCLTVIAPLVTLAALLILQWRWQKAQEIELRRAVREALREHARGKVCTAYLLLEAAIDEPARGWCRRTERRMRTAGLNCDEIKLARDIVLGEVD